MGLVKVVMLFWTKIASDQRICLHTVHKPPTLKDVLDQQWGWENNSVADYQGTKCCHRLNFHSPHTWDEGDLWPCMAKAWKHKDVANLSPCACFVCPKLLQNNCTMLTPIVLKLLFLSSYLLSQRLTTNPHPKPLTLGTIKYKYFLIPHPLGDATTVKSPFFPH